MYIKANISYFPGYNDYEMFQDNGLMVMAAVTHWKTELEAINAAKEMAKKLGIEFKEN
jgi:hypothetical protein